MSLKFKLYVEPMKIYWTLIGVYKVKNNFADFLVTMVIRIFHLQENLNTLNLSLFVYITNIWVALIWIKTCFISIGWLTLSKYFEKINKTRIPLVKLEKQASVGT